jgi:hypothetical protein
LQILVLPSSFQIPRLAEKLKRSLKHNNQPSLEVILHYLSLCSNAVPSSSIMSNFFADFDLAFLVLALSTFGFSDCHVLVWLVLTVNCFRLILAARSLFGWFV